MNHEMYVARRALPCLWIIAVFRADPVRGTDVVTARVWGGARRVSDAIDRIRDAKDRKSE